MIYIAQDVVDFSVEKGVFYKLGKSKIVAKNDMVNLYDVGDKIDLYVMGYKIFEGYIRYKNERGGVCEYNVAKEGDVFYRRYVRKIIYPIDVGKSESMDISDIVRYIVETYSNFSHSIGGLDTIIDTGVKITKFVINEYLNSALNRLSKAVGYVWYIENGIFYFEEPKYVGSDVLLDNSIAVFDKWKVRTDRLVNDLHLICAPKEYIRSDFFRGDGTTREFRLSYVPSGNIRVFINGVEQSSDSFQINYDVPSIIFENPPEAYSGSVGDALAQQYVGWAWRRKITISIDASATPTSITDPVILIRLGDNDIDWQNINGDYSDIRFAWTDGTNVVDFPYVYLGMVGSDRYFAVKLQGKTLNAGDTIDIYILYGNSNAPAPTWSKSDVMNEYDVFNYGSCSTSLGMDLDSSKWNLVAVDGYGCYDSEGCGKNDLLVKSWYVRVCGSGKYAKLYLELTTDIGNYDYATGVLQISSNSLSNTARWVFYMNGLKYVDRNQLIFYLWARYPEQGGYANYYGITLPSGYNPESIILNEGVWYFDIFSIEPTITIGDRVLNANYNIEVRYSFKAPIYVRVEDKDSQNRYGIYSKVIRANWITDYDMARLMANKYIEQYGNVLNENTLKLQLYKYLQFGLKSGMKVMVNDSLSNIGNVFVIYSEKITPKTVKINIGTEVFDIFEWGAKVEERIRQLEVAGDENFFTP